MGYMRTVKVHLKPDEPLAAYADRVTRLANNLSNAVRFRQRQVLTAVSKPETDWTDNEREVMEEVRVAISQMKKPPKFPYAGHSFLSYTLLEQMLRSSNNPDFFVEGLPKQTAQHVIKQAVKDMKSFYASCREYQVHPESFTGKPKLPGYKKKGGCCTADITNQDCTITLKNGKWYAGLPLAKDKPVCIGCPIPEASLKEACIVPENGRFVLHFKFEVNQDLPGVPETAKRICAVDFGVENLMAVANNCGLPCLLYKGGAAKAMNQLYNKKIAAIVSEQTKATGKKFHPTEEYYLQTNSRNDQISDCLLKTAKHFVTWCVENRIDTVVMGVNRDWKQEVELGHKNNQDFVQIPFFRLQEIISYLCEWNGIRCVTREESYTSKASFLDQDPIPVYQKGQKVSYHFSGRRRPTTWHGIKKKNGFRGLYVSGDGTIINADLNGAANILRKEYPQAFSDGIMPDFNQVLVIRHPDLTSRKKNLEKQMSAPKHISRAKAKRLKRKANAANQQKPAAT